MHSVRQMPGRWLIYLASGLVFFIINVGINRLMDPQGLQADLLEGLLTSIFFVLIFWTSMHWLARYLNRKLSFEFPPGETACFESGANLRRGREAVGGKLFLSDQRLVFISHQYNVQRDPLEIERDRIAQVVPHKSLGFISNGLQLKTTEGRVYHFVVDQQDKWLKVLHGN
ncbi:MAG: hypothetical protein ACLFUB_18915 [Cyclobacteriaceae bacterium]